MRALRCALHRLDRVNETAVHEHENFPRVAAVRIGELDDLRFDVRESASVGVGLFHLIEVAGMIGKAPGTNDKLCDLPIKAPADRDQLLHSFQVQLIALGIAADMDNPVQVDKISTMTPEDPLISPELLFQLL